MNFNSYRLVNKGIKGPERAKVLGHSVTTNEKHYSFEDLEYCEIVREKLNEKD